MSERTPSALRFGAVSFKVLKLGDGRLAFAHYASGPRTIVKRRTLPELRAEAERIALGILNAETAALDVTAEERRIFIAARETLRPHGIEVDRGARLVADAIALCGSAEKILEACRQYQALRPECVQTPTGEVVAHLLRHLSDDGVGAYYYDKLEADLQRFAAQFPGPIAEIRNADMETWLREMKMRDGATSVGPRRRRNYRDKLVTLFNFAQEKGYVPQNVTHEAEKVKRPKVPRKPPAIYTPAELDVLIGQCLQPPDRRSGRKDYSDFLPALAIAAFAGLRWEEIKSLDWQRNIHWEQRVITVGEEEKTGYRVVPMEANLMTFLAPYKDRFGRVCPYPRTDNIMRRLGMRAGLPVGGRRYANALRHSCVTYMVARDQDMGAAAIKFGHSVQELRKSYYRPQLESAGRAWFAIQRGWADNVALLSFGSR